MQRGPHYRGGPAGEPLSCRQVDGQHSLYRDRREPSVPDEFDLSPPQDLWGHGRAGRSHSGVGRDAEGLPSPRHRRQLRGKRFEHEKNELSSVSADHISLFKGLGGAEKILETIECQNLHINEFMRAHYGAYCDYLSVDVEGLDALLLSEMDHVFQPTLIQCEHEGRIAQFAEILKPRGYSLLAQTDVNAIFLKTALL